jgi:spore maturation protein SpmA
MGSTFESAKTAFEISIGLTGVLSLWMGIMEIGERSGLVHVIARWLSPLMVRLFPEIPAGHPVFGHIFMNFSANMLGLDNAATPLGLKAMEGMQELNKQKDTATNAMIMFLVLNTSGLTLIPVGVMTYRAVAGAAQPTDVFIPILIATAIATLAGMIITSLYQHINLFNRTIMAFVLGLCLVVSGVIWIGTQVDQETMNKWSTVVANVLLFSIIMAFIWAGVRKKINVYEAFVEGAKGGFDTAIRIIPYLVAILVAIGVFRASGAMDFIIDGLGKFVEMLGGNADYVAALPTAIMKPLSGSGARGMMVDAMQQYGPDSFVGRLSCIFQGATDTTFYILAVYFGSVGIRKTRHAVMAGLLTDICGVIAAIGVAALFFG